MPVTKSQYKLQLESQQNKDIRHHVVANLQKYMMTLLTSKIQRGNKCYLDLFSKSFSFQIQIIMIS